MVRAFALCAFFGVAAFGQPGKGPEFETASVKLAEGGIRTITAGPASLTIINTPVPDCIGYAYGMQGFQIIGPPDIKWVSLTINAKSAEPVKEAELKLMLQSLLTERLKLTFHREKKEMNTYVLTIAKGGHKLKQAAAAGSPSFSTGKMNLTGKGATIAQLTQFLSKELREPVIDQTGLTDLYDYFLDISMYITDEIRRSGVDGPPPEAAGIVAGAMQSQLGLKVEPKKAPVEMIVVDRVEKTPIEN